MAIFLANLLTNTFTGLTLTLANSNSVRQGIHGRLDPQTGGSTSTNLVLSHVQHFRSLVKAVPRYSLLTFVQVPSARCLAFCHHWSPRSISLQLTPLKLWKSPSLVCIYRFLSTRMGSLSLEACLITLSTRLNRVEQCLA